MGLIVKTKTTEKNCIFHYATLFRVLLSFQKRCVHVNKAEPELQTGQSELPSEKHPQKNKYIYEQFKQQVRARKDRV